MSASAARELELEGVYVTLEQLLSLRHRKLTALRRAVLAHSNHGGNRQSRHRGRGIDFAEVRLYQAGDDVRSIDWRVTARRAKPHTKVFREERERPTLILVDQSQSMFFGSRRRLKSVLAAEAAALLAWNALDVGERVGGIIFGNHEEHVFKPYRSSRSVVRFLGELARCNQLLSRSTQRQPDQLLASLQHAYRVARGGHRIFVISDFSEFDEQQRKQLINLARFNDLTVLFVSDPMDRELPPADRYAITDGEQRAVLFSGDHSFRKRYRDRHQQRTEQLGELCRQADIHLLAVETTDTISRLIAEQSGI